MVERSWVVAFGIKDTPDLKVDSWVFHSVPLRAEYVDKGTEPDPNCDFMKMEAALKDAGIKIIYRTVQTVPPYHGTVWVPKADEEKAKKVLTEKGIKWHPQTLLFPTKVLHPEPLPWVDMKTGQMIPDWKKK